jgi:hypothetical protein
MRTTTTTRRRTTRNAKNENTMGIELWINSEKWRLVDDWRLIMTYNISQLTHDQRVASSGWWFQTFWNIWKSMGRIIPYIMKNKTCSKPPTSVYMDTGMYIYIYLHLYIDKTKDIVY